MRLLEHVARMRDMRNAYKILVGKLEGNRPLARPRRRWEYNIKVDLRKTGLKGVDWIHLTQDRNQRLVLINMVMSRYPFFESCCGCLHKYTKEKIPSHTTFILLRVKIIRATCFDHI
jgi:hypothetical protein